MLGGIRFAQKRWQEAIDIYRRAVERGSKALDVRVHTVWALIELKRYDEAAWYGKDALAKGYSHRAMHRYVAEALFRARRLPDSIPHLERALLGFPNDLYLMDHLRQAYTAAGRSEDAKAMTARIADVESSLGRGERPAS